MRMRLHLLLSVCGLCERASWACAALVGFWRTVRFRLSQPKTQPALVLVQNESPAETRNAASSVRPESVNQGLEAVCKSMSTPDEGLIAAPLARWRCSLRTPPAGAPQVSQAPSQAHLIEVTDSLSSPSIESQIKQKCGYYMHVRSHTK